MDFRQAQRNLELVHAVVDQENNVNIPTSVELEEDVMGTQVPLPMFSDDEESLKIASSRNSSQKLIENIGYDENMQFKEIKSETTNIELENTTLKASKNDSMSAMAGVSDFPENADYINGKYDDKGKVITIPDLDYNDDFGDSTIEKNNNEIFISTQIQGRLDDFEQETNLKRSMKSTLDQFKYPDSDSQPSKTFKNTSLKKRKSPVTVKKSPVKVRKSKKEDNTIKTGTNLSRAENILKLLSGKHRKVRDIIKVQKDIEAKKSKTNNKNHTVTKFDTYNEQEWKHLTKLISNLFPAVEDVEIKEVYQYIYGEEQEYLGENLWEASQTPLTSMHERTKGDGEDVGRAIPYVASNFKISNVEVISLSQVMNDKSFSEAQRNTEEENIFEIPDSTDDEAFDIIPMKIQAKSITTKEQSKNEILKNNIILAPSSAHERESTSDSAFFTASNSMANSVIDLTQGSFKAVNSLISPVKTDLDNLTQSHQIQVPATRTATLISDNQINQSLNHSNTKIYDLTQGESVLYQAYGEEKQLLDKNNNSNIEFIKKYQIEVGDSEDENKDEMESSIIELKIIPNIQSNTPFNSPTKSFKDVITSQSMKKLREDMKNIGLKPLKSKEKIIKALTIASQLFDENELGQEHQRQEVYNHLTSLVKQIPQLLEKIYTFEPITIEDLISQLSDFSPFVDHLDETTIKEWADRQGVCLRNQ